MYHRIILLFIRQKKSIEIEGDNKWPDKHNDIIAPIKRE